jgi:hypothetical protein
MLVSGSRPPLKVVVINLDLRLPAIVEAFGVGILISSRCSLAIPLANAVGAHSHLMINQSVVHFDQDHQTHLHSDARNVEVVGTMVRGLFERLNHDCVAYLVMRNYHGYPDVLHKPDIGLLISDNHRRRFVQSVITFCRDTGCACYQLVDRKSGIALQIIRFEADEGSPLRPVLLKVDARTYESFDLTILQKVIRGFSYRIFFNDVRNRMICRGDCRFYVFDQPDELIFLLKQWKRKQHPRYRDEIVSSLQEPKLNHWFCKAANITAPVDARAFFANRYLDVYDELSWKLVRARWGSHGLRRVLTGQLRVLRARLSGLKISIGPLFYFTGPDGSGKTTLIGAVSEVLAQQGVKFRSYYSLQRYLRFIGRRLAWMAVSRRHGSRVAGTASGARLSWQDFRWYLSEVEHGDRDPGTRTWRLRRRAALIIGVLDILLGYSVTWLFRLAGYIVLVETSPFDVFVKYHMPEFVGTEKLLARLIPKPTLGLWIDVEPDRLIARKSELTAIEVKNYYARMQQVLQRAKVRDRFVTIDNNSLPEKSAGEACLHVFRCLGVSRLGD